MRRFPLPYPCLLTSLPLACLNISTTHIHTTITLYTDCCTPTQPEGAEGQQRTFLLGYDGRGFEVRDVNYRGSILAFPRACFLWRARTIEDVTPEALAPILMVKPPIGAFAVRLAFGVGECVGV